MFGIVLQSNGFDSEIEEQEWRGEVKEKTLWPHPATLVVVRVSFRHWRPVRRAEMLDGHLPDSLCESEVQPCGVS